MNLLSKQHEQTIVKFAKFDKSLVKAKHSGHKVATEWVAFHASKKQQQEQTAKLCDDKEFMRPLELQGILFSIFLFNSRYYFC